MDNIGNGGMNMGNMPPELEALVRQEVERRAKLAEAIAHFYAGDYVAISTLELPVSKVSWDGANDMVPQVLVCKAKRKELGIDVGDVVKVQAGERTLPCIVNPQFRDSYEGVSLNRLAAHALGAAVAQVVKVSSLL